MAKQTVKILFKLPKDAPDREEALAWANLYEDRLSQAIAECPRGDWLIWMMSSSRIDRQKLIATVCQSLLSTISHLFDRLEPCDLPFERGLEIVEQWLSGVASTENCQTALDELNFEQLDSSRFDPEESIDEDPISIANEMVEYLLNACLEVDRANHQNEIAYNLAWSINTAARLDSILDDSTDFQEALAEYSARIIRYLNR